MSVYIVYWKKEECKCVDLSTALDVAKMLTRGEYEANNATIKGMKDDELQSVLFVTWLPNTRTNKWELSGNIF